MKYIDHNFDTYKQKVYAAVLGKIIGVYMGRPVEGWHHEQIMDRLGEIWYYPHEKCNKPLIVTDDDITGTFTFLRAIEDYPEALKNLKSEQIGETWLNYVIENRTIFWWGGLGISTEHTAYQRLKDGIKAPKSGSIELNGKTVAEQIGGQIFIDGWALIVPGDPEAAVSMAKEAASVSHDGEGVIAAQMIAAIESLAFVESDMKRLIERALGFIPQNSQTADIVRNVLRLSDVEPDWKKGVSYLYDNYPYSNYGGACPIVPNHGLIILALIYGKESFQLSQMIVNSAGWDTDCNAANVGCIMGIFKGLEGINETADFRGPVADRLYLPTAEGGRGISDALELAQWIINLGARYHGRAPYHPKQGAKFNFEAEGAVQGFISVESPDRLKQVSVGNSENMSPTGKHALAIGFRHLSPGLRAEVKTLTGIPIEYYKAKKTAYDLIASPTLISGQTMKSSLYLESASHARVIVSLFVNTVRSICDDGKGDSPCRFAVESYSSDYRILEAGRWEEMEFRVPNTNGAPVSHAGFQILHPDDPASPWSGETVSESVDGTLHVDYLDWSGIPDSYLWRKGWVNHAVDRIWASSGDDCYQLQTDEKPIIFSKTDGTGFMTQGNRSWKDYGIKAAVTPRLFKSGGVVIYYQGQSRYISLALSDQDRLRLIEREGKKTTIISEAPFPYNRTREYLLSIRIGGERIEGFIDDALVLEGRISHQLRGGGCGLFVEYGSLELSSFQLEPMLRG